MSFTDSLNDAQSVEKITLGNKIPIFTIISFHLSFRLKGSSDQIHFIFENNVGKSRIRHKTTLDRKLRFPEFQNSSKIQIILTLISITD